nr:MAG TPA: TIGR02217 family protein [Caudoviricetes sp.]
MAWDSNWSPQFVFAYGPQFKTEISSFESGKEQRRQKWSTDRKRFHLVYNHIAAATAAAILAEFESCKGAFSTFSWTNPADSTSYTVRFVEDSLQLQYVTTNVVKLEFDFIEVI